jgi:uncharacterized protein YdeI (YjbR/CyaY-like superfamily)
MTPAAEQPKPELEILQCAADADWERWLVAHHADSPGVWLKFAKKGSEIATVKYAQALDTALCYGWIEVRSVAWTSRSTCSGSRAAVRAASGRRSTATTSPG